MFFSRLTRQSTAAFSKQIDKLRAALDVSDAVVIGAGAGLSTAAGYTDSGERFEKLFGDFAARYGFTDMYSGGFYPYDSLEEYWAFWSRYIMCNRYDPVPTPLYEQLLSIVRDRDYFVLTTNVDHCFQRAGFDKQRLFYTQGDYGLFQCSKPCCQETWDNEELVHYMVAAQEDLRSPSALVPRCPHCGSPLTMNLRADDTFVQDKGWYTAANRYQDFLRRQQYAHSVLGAWRRRQHARHHQVSVLADDSQKRARHVCMRQPWRGSRSDRNRQSQHSDRRRCRARNRSTCRPGRQIAMTS